MRESTFTNAICKAESKQISKDFAYCEDTISRQAAIDALDEIETEVADGLGFQYEKWRKYFSEMPSAQPEIIHCRDCRHRSHDAGYGRDWCNRMSGVFRVKPDDYCSYAERRTDE